MRLKELVLPLVLISVGSVDQLTVTLKKHHLYFVYSEQSILGIRIIYLMWSMGIAKSGAAGNQELRKKRKRNKLKKNWALIVSK